MYAYNHTGAIATTGLFVDYEWPVGIFEVQCNGNESTIWNCSYTTIHDGQACSQYTDASVFCMRKFVSYLTAENPHIFSSN